MKTYLIRLLVDYNYMEFEIATNGDIIEAIRAAKKEAKPAVKAEAKKPAAKKTTKK